MELTSDESNFTGGFFIGTGHHGPHCVVHDGHHIQLKLLKRKKASVYSFAHWSIFNQTMPLEKTYLSPLNGIPQQSHHIFAFTVCGLEALRPCDQDALHTHNENRMKAFHCEIV